MTLHEFISTELSDIVALTTKKITYLCFKTGVPNPRAATHYLTAACSKLSRGRNGQLQSSIRSSSMREAPFVRAAGKHAHMHEAPLIRTEGACTCA